MGVLLAFKKRNYIGPCSLEAYSLLFLLKRLRKLSLPLLLHRVELRPNGL